MNSRDRVLKVLSGELPDRVPISTYELCGFNSKAFENNEKSYSGLMEYIRKNTDGITMWRPDSDETEFATAGVCETEVKEYRTGDRQIIDKIMHTPLGDLTHKQVIIDGINTVWETEHWCKTIEDIDRAMSIPFKPVSFDSTDFGRVKDEIGDKGIIMASLSDAMCYVMEMMEFGNATVWAMTESEHFDKTITEIHERIMVNLRRMLDENVVDLYRICGAEYSTPPYMPPSVFERYVMPFDKQMSDLIHERGAKTRLHSHGRIRNVLENILATGADALDPCEAPPDGDITLAELKSAVGGRMCIFGNLELKLLENGSREEVRAEVIRCMDAAKKGGGYVIMPTAAPINVPLKPKTEENYITFIDTAVEYGGY